MLDLILGPMRLARDMLIWQGRIEGALFVGLLLIGLYLLTRKERR